MKIKFLFLFLFLSSILFSEDLVNYSYMQSRIKSKVRNKLNSKNKKVCYIYVNINGNREWRKYKNKLNTTIRKNQHMCKRYVIYKVVKNVHTSYFRSSASNSSNKNYKINLGAIVEENSNIDIQIYTIIKNSKLNSGFSEQKVNTGIVNSSNDIDGVRYKVHSNIKSSEVGQQSFMSKVGLNMAKKFLKEDRDSPLN